MATVQRLAGALLAHTQGTFYLVGDLKEPLHYGEAGFVDPGERHIQQNPITVLTPLARDDEVLVLGRGDHFATSLEGEELAHRLAQFFLIRRNGSVSERLWRLVMESSHPIVPALECKETGKKPGSEGQRRSVDARWLATTPWPVWEAVRDAVLRC